MCIRDSINHIQAYLYQKKEWNPKWENAFAPALCLSLIHIYVPSPPLSASASASVSVSSGRASSRVQVSVSSLWALAYW